MMADRNVASLAVPCRAECSRAIRWMGRLAGDVSSAADWGTKESPVIAPPAPRLTSAVACCHQGLVADGTAHLLPDDTARRNQGDSSVVCQRHADRRSWDRRFRIAWTC